MAYRWFWLVVVLALACAGCAAKAGEQMAKLKVGMTESEVKKALGPPEASRCVRFTGHDSDYLVWEYQMVPEIGPTCASEGAARFITGFATLGVSEVAWSHAKAVPHWVYFLHGMMVYSSPAFDCKTSQTCKVRIKTARGACLP